MPSSRKDTRRVAQRRIVQDATCMKRKLPCDVDTDSNQTVKILPDRTKDVLEPELADIHLTDDTSTNETNKRRNMEQQSWDTLEYRWTEGQDLPEGWDDEEDLEEDDFEMRIARYKRRILQNIMPGYFEVKKEGLEKRINIIAEICAAEPGVSPCTAERIGSLKKIQRHLEDEGDPCKELPNIAAIIAAYRSQQLTWDDRVTYWRGGVLVGGPHEELSWEEFRRLNGDNKGESGFWVEGRGGPGATPTCYQNALYRRKTYEEDYTIKLDVRLGENMDTIPSTLPVGVPQVDFDFIDDTGASTFVMYKDDRMRLMGPGARPRDYPWPQIMGYTIMQTSSGHEYIRLCIAIQVNIKDILNQYMLASWLTVECLFSNDISTSYALIMRLCPGRWLRANFFQATAPEMPQWLYLSTHKAGILDPNMLPAVNPAHVKVPTIPIPSVAAGYTIKNGRRKPVQRTRQRGRNPDNPRPLREVAPPGPPPFT